MDSEHLSPLEGASDQADRTPSAISLADILARNVPLYWYESVAIVAGLCATLDEQQIPGVPRPEGVSLTRDGRVTVHGRSRLLGITALPRLLEALLETGSPPPPLRLFVLHAMASHEATSIAAFAASLEYYERPGRSELVQAVYQRVLETPADSPAGVPREIQLEDDRPAPPPEERSRSSRWWLAAGVLLVGAGGALWYGVATSPGSAAPALDRAAANVRAMVGEVEDAARAVAAAVQEKVATVLDPPAVSTAAPLPEPAPPVRRRSAGNAAARRELPPATPPAQIISIAAEDLAGIKTAVQPALTEPELVAFPFAAVDGSVIYSSIADDVSPPILRNPHRMPGSLQVAGERPSNAVEILISETGRVERVTMVSPSTHLTDMMLLGAAKTWEFEPATRNGVPVKFRLRLDWVEGQR